MSRDEIRQMRVERVEDGFIGEVHYQDSALRIALGPSNLRNAVIDAIAAMEKGRRPNERTQ